MQPILIQDLGMKYPTKNSKRKYRFGVYQCPDCNDPYETTSSSVDSGSSKRCKTCAMKKASKTTLKGLK